MLKQYDQLGWYQVCVAVPAPELEIWHSDMSYKFGYSRIYHHVVSVYTLKQHIDNKIAGVLWE